MYLGKELTLRVCYTEHLVMGSIKPIEVTQCLLTWLTNAYKDVIFSCQIHFLPQLIVARKELFEAKTVLILAGVYIYYCG